MSTPMAIEAPEISLGLGRRFCACLAVGAARLLATQQPARIRHVLARLARGARPADFDHALSARQAVMAVSLTCRGARGCVPRSIATMLLCRPSGAVPTWCVGVRALAPFAAHAWVEADGVMVGESVPPGYLRTLLRVTAGGDDGLGADGSADDAAVGAA
ncbi:Transglutaminase-like superfamily [Frankia sp. AiPs1]|uniref:lasso peptide biosynthesis B2 protein n=1 Tax=Frankia sp. AiPa1 TaxID=573492 RepID=UPI00202AE659|nr:lasso peptide biosynthesis B2 protein [Frankia sp. AiPa1]MCL9760614.1 lasso peptide biosynthesis B2 protein [Frankia sp. AiPa1]